MNDSDSVTCNMCCVSVRPALLRLLAGGLYTLVFQLGSLFLPDSIFTSHSFYVRYTRHFVSHIRFTDTFILPQIYYVCPSPQKTYTLCFGDNLLSVECCLSKCMIVAVAWLLVFNRSSLLRQKLKHRYLQSVMGAS